MKFKKNDYGFLVRCDIGDEIVATIAKFASENNIASGTIAGIGAVKNVTLGYFDPNAHEYLKKEFKDTCELISLDGNFAKLGSEYILHCHVVISDRNFSVFGGHLFAAEIAVTGEFYLRTEGMEINRGPDDLTGLNLLKL